MGVSPRGIVAANPAIAVPDYPRAKCTILNPAVSTDPTQFVQLGAARPKGEQPTARRSLFGLNSDEFGALMVEMGEPTWRRTQLSEAIYRQRVESISEITTLSKTLREKLVAAGWEVGRPRLAQVFESVDGTERYLVQCAGNSASTETTENQK